MKSDSSDTTTGRVLIGIGLTYDACRLKCQDATWCVAFMIKDEGITLKSCYNWRGKDLEIAGKGDTTDQMCSTLASYTSITYPETSVF